MKPHFKLLTKFFRVIKNQVENVELDNLTGHEFYDMHG